jgi:hypothetical protein
MPTQNISTTLIGIFGNNVYLGKKKTIYREKGHLDKMTRNTLKREGASIIHTVNY